MAKAVQEGACRAPHMVISSRRRRGLKYRPYAFTEQGVASAIADDSDLEEGYNTARHLLYVACTRARDHLLVTSVEPASEFLDDLREI